MVAAARKLLTYLYYGLRDGEDSRARLRGRGLGPSRTRDRRCHDSHPIVVGAVAPLIDPVLLEPHRPHATPAWRRDHRQPNPWMRLRGITGERVTGRPRPAPRGGCSSSPVGGVRLVGGHRLMRSLESGWGHSRRATRVRAQSGRGFGDGKGR